MKNIMKIASVITSVRSCWSGIFCASLACLGLPFSSVTAQSLVFHYEFDGISVTDSSGNGYNLGIQGAASLGSAGGREGVLNLNATAQRSPNAAIGKEIAFAPETPLSQYTVTGWLYTGASGISAGTVLSLGSSTDNRMLSVSIDSNGVTSIKGVAQPVEIPTRYVDITASTVWKTPDQWVFFAITIDTTVASGGSNWTNAVKLYLGDDQAASTLTRLNNKGLVGTGGATLADSYLISGFDTIAIGNGYNSVTGTASPNEALRSNISVDDLRFYSGVLDATALNAIRLQGIPEPSTVAVLAGCGVMAVAFFSRRS